MMWTLTLTLGATVHSGQGPTPRDAWLNIPDGRKLDPNLQMGYGHWVAEMAKRFEQDATLTKFSDTNKCNPLHHITLTFQP